VYLLYVIYTHPVAGLCEESRHSFIPRGDRTGHL